MGRMRLRGEIDCVEKTIHDMSRLVKRDQFNIEATKKSTKRNNKLFLDGNKWCNEIVKCKR